MSSASPAAFRPNLRDPLAERMIGPGKAWELEEVMVRGRPHQVFKGMPRNLAGIFRRSMDFAERQMIAHQGTSFTYAEGFARAAALGRALRDDFGVKPGTRVAVIAANSPEWILSLIAVTSIGGVASLVHSRGAAEEMLLAIERVGCEVVIVDAVRDDILSAARPDPAWPRVVIGDARQPLRPGRDADFAALTTPVPSLAFDPVDIHPDEGAVILFTSGTTGFPKGALLSHGALAASIAVATFMGVLYDTR